MLTYRENISDMIAGSPVMPNTMKHDLITVFVSAISNRVCREWSYLIVEYTRFFYNGYGLLGREKWLDVFKKLLRFNFNQAKANAVYRNGYYPIYETKDGKTEFVGYENDIFFDNDIKEAFEAVFPPEYKKSGHKYEYGRRIY